MLEFFDDKLLSHFDLSIFFQNCGRNILDTKITPTIVVDIFTFVKSSKHIDSSPHSFVLVYIRILTDNTLLSVNIIELKYILTGRNMLDSKKYIPNYFLEVILFTILCKY